MGYTDFADQAPPRRRRFGCGTVLGISAIGCLGVVVIGLIIAAIYVVPMMISGFDTMAAAASDLSRVMGAKATIAAFYMHDPGHNLDLKNIVVANPRGFGGRPMLKVADAAFTEAHQATKGRPARAQSATLQGVRFTVVVRGKDDNLAWELRFLGRKPKMKPNVMPKAPAAAAPAKGAPVAKTAGLPRVILRELTIGEAVVLVRQKGHATLHYTIAPWTLHMAHVPALNAAQPQPLRVFARLALAHIAKGLLAHHPLPPALRAQLRHAQ